MSFYEIQLLQDVLKSKQLSSQALQTQQNVIIAVRHLFSTILPEMQNISTIPTFYIRHNSIQIRSKIRTQPDHPSLYISFS